MDSWATELAPDLLGEKHDFQPADQKVFSSCSQSRWSQRVHTGGLKALIRFAGKLTCMAWFYVSRNISSQLGPKEIPQGAVIRLPATPFYYTWKAQQLGKQVHQPNAPKEAQTVASTHHPGLNNTERGFSPHQKHGPSPAEPLGNSQPATPSPNHSEKTDQRTSCFCGVLSFSVKYISTNCAIAHITSGYSILFLSGSLLTRGAGALTAGGVTSAHSQLHCYPKSVQHHPQAEPEARWLPPHPKTDHKTA